MSLTPLQTFTITFFDIEKNVKRLLNPFFFVLYSIMFYCVFVIFDCGYCIYAIPNITYFLLSQKKTKLIILRLYKKIVKGAIEKIWPFYFGPSLYFFWREKNNFSFHCNLIFLPKFLKKIEKFGKILMYQYYSSRLIINDWTKGINERQTMW